MDKVELLRSVPLFADLDKRSLEAVSVLARERDVPAGEVFMKEGDPADAFYVIAGGTVHVQRAGETVRSMTAGGFLGEIAMLEGGPRTATATAETDTQLLVIQRHEFDRLMASFPHIERRIRTATTRRPHGHGGDAEP